MIAATEKPKAYRLPTYAYPRRYDMKIDARLGRDEVPGKVTIQLDIREETDTIELHAKEMELKSATLTAGGRTLDGRIKQDEVKEMAALTFPESVSTGEATLVVEYMGHVSKGLEGLYLAKDGPEECLCTQCEETEARAIFPCFDEPAYKARFTWHVTTGANMTVITNAPLESTVDSGDGSSRTWHFRPTQVMSSYLVALVIGDIASGQEKVVNNVPLRIWSMRGKEQMGDFALNYTARLLPYYEDYFGQPYHFDKLDQAAVPGFSAGAMENAGLVLYRQPYLLMNPEATSWNQEKVVALVVAHEFAHMWFGDLVTMKWWDDIWLNEAFAEWMANKAVDHLNPDYDIWPDFQGGKNAALAADAQESTHPIYSPVETPAEAAELFDAITYEKGCSVMRMLEHFLGEDSFRAGIRTYMKDFRESNATSADLWRHLQQASSQPVTDIMQGWITQAGYPVVHVSLEQDGERQDSTGVGAQGSARQATLRLGQQRFFSKPGVENPGLLWRVPLVIRYEDNAGITEMRYLLSKDDDTVSFPVEGDLKWCNVNADEIGFYRQNLDGSLLHGLLNNLDKLSPLEQMGLLGDQWALVRNGTNKINRFLDVLVAMAGLNNYSVLQEVVGRLHGIEGLLQEAGDEAALAAFRKWAGETFKGQLEKLTWEPKEGESQNEVQRRASLIDAMTVLAEDEGAERRAFSYADREAENSTSVDPNLAGVFVGVAAHFGDASRFDRYLQVYEQRRAAGASPQETNRYLYAFPAFRPKELVQRTLGLLDDGTLPQESIGPLVRQMFSTLHAREKAWGWVTTHWDVIKRMGDNWVNAMLAASGNLPESYRDQLVKFYEANLNGEAGISYRRALETIDQQAEFKARTRQDLLDWFKNR